MFITYIHINGQGFLGPGRKDVAWMLGVTPQGRPWERARGAQPAPATFPETPREARKTPSGSQERPKSDKERAKRGQERPKSGQERPKSVPKAILEASWLVSGPSWRAKSLFFIEFFNTF